jgi:hypothetical protein
VGSSYGGGYSGQSGHNSAYSGASTASTLHSCAGSFRTRTKKDRRERFNARLKKANTQIFPVDRRERFQERFKKANAHVLCVGCEVYFSSPAALKVHKTGCHPKKQFFPCTFCEKEFENQAEWEKHEYFCHCQPQLTWFCMLDASVDTGNCIFCRDDCLPSLSHYIQAHKYEDCGLALHSRAFSTRHEMLQHLATKHGMSTEEISLAEDRIDQWSLQINTSCNGGLWRCGYCGYVGADWNHRLQHINWHWTIGGPEFTRTTPWSGAMSYFDHIGVHYFKALDSGENIEKSRPMGLHFYNIEHFEAAAKYRALLRVEKWVE